MSSVAATIPIRKEMTPFPQNVRPETAQAVEVTSEIGRGSLFSFVIPSYAAAVA